MTDCLACEQETAGEYLCARCTERVGAELRSLPALYEALGAYLRPSSQISIRVGSGTPAPDAPLPVFEDALDLIGPGGIVTALEDWRFELCQDAQIRWGSPFGDYRGRLRRAVAGLHNMLEYVQNWSRAGEFAAAVHTMHSSARSIVAPRERRLRAGTCTQETEGGEVCGAVLFAVPGRPVVCTWCSTRYPASTWLDLAAEIHRAA
ncbi:hypothetical protein [Kitasatospora sp. CB02891]|uniref:hypothetical protein n=1 Tax=Kitasatospora sp. CB02891 TaxID=2020329 RepID=UPI000C274CDA|nr:hypothetical protein [Kitasatospora sp. CB02891]PJN22400.1 hypothetical protein CG736_28215 [Kitasatospora sp. CB02891]